VHDRSPGERRGDSDLARADAPQPERGHGPTSACSAIGVTHASGIFASHWSGSNWVAQTVPAPGSHAGLNAIDCTSATACMAVGTYRSGPEVVTLAERYS
jgi:hypothetical protein